MESGQPFTLSELARSLEAQQHQLIHLCEKDVVVPDFRDAHGRGSSRLFSARNMLEFAVALRLRSAMLPVAAVGAVLRVLRAFEGRLTQDLRGFSLPGSLRENGAPDLRVIVSDGSTIYFSLGAPGSRPRLFGGIPLEQVAGDKPGQVKAVHQTSIPASSNGKHGVFGGPEGSQFVRLELSVTEIARALPLD